MKQTIIENKVVLVADDSILQLELWSMLPIATKLYETPESILDDLQNGVLELESLLCLVTDFYFDERTNLSGGDLAEQVKAICPNLPIFISSDMDLNLCDQKKAYSQISKDPQEAWKQVKQWLSTQS